MKTTNRRIFLLQVAAAGSAVAASQVQTQADLPKVDQKDPQAVALAYVKDTTKADKKKFSKRTAEQKCSGCQLYLGKPKETSGPCPLYPATQVGAVGLCSTRLKKA